ncbi:thiamine pyrophosphate-binding protein [Spirillospora sp. CA-294931]|uniref:thiamine pyrophosphate-binding protein n=1 Tax=Spirillospora sp. CA-294931 TaxID=3240042 RepID=UPI003D8F2C1D
MSRLHRPLAAPVAPADGEVADEPDNASPGIDVDLMAKLIATAYPDSCFATPCGVLAPLLDALLTFHSRFTIVHREDNALALASGAAITGKRAVVLMQNSGFGQSVNVLASLVGPFTAPIGLIVSMRGTEVDDTWENRGMGRATIPVLESLGLAWRELDRRGWKETLTWFGEAGRDKPATLLVPPSLFGWSPAQ